jgi:hypothetical protein
MSAKVRDRDRIEVDGARLYSHAGTLLEISPDRLVIDGHMTLSGNAIIGANSAIVIAKGSVGIGAGPGGPPTQLLDDD